MLASVATGHVSKKWCHVVCYIGKPEIPDSLIKLCYILKQLGKMLLVLVDEFHVHENLC
jgi:hypothetical protein